MKAVPTGIRSAVEAERFYGHWCETDHCDRGGINPMAAEPAVTSGMSTPQALRLLPIPDTLSGPQRDGHVCVWGGEALTSDTAIDLGSRPIDGSTAFPRGCRTCTGNAALGVLFDHTSDCTDCKDDTACDTGRALNRVIRLGRR